MMTSVPGFLSVDYRKPRSHYKNIFRTGKLDILVIGVFMLENSPNDYPGFQVFMPENPGFTGGPILYNLNLNR